MSAIPHDPHIDEGYNFDHHEGNNSDNNAPADHNQLNPAEFDYEAAMRAIGRRGAAEVAVMRGTAAAHEPQQLSGLGRMIGKYIGGQRGGGVTPSVLTPENFTAGIVGKMGVFASSQRGGRKSRKAQKRGRKTRRHRR